MGILPLKNLCKYHLINYLKITLLIIFTIQSTGCGSAGKFRKVRFDSSEIRLKFQVNDQIAYTPCKILIPESCNEAFIYMPDGTIETVSFNLLPKNPSFKNNIKKISSWSIQLLALPFMILGGGVLGLYALDSSEDEHNEDDLLIMISALLLTGFGALLNNSAEKLNSSIKEDFVYFDLSHNPAG